ncbi:MAG TPA: outer membrane beta-barrel protein [Acidobacteriaceae bacterium]|nr:outer membrane beta-barrel protein [Acidobacteriaceae bacterium]
MQKFSLAVLALLLCGISPSLIAQRRFEAGVFIDYLDVSQTSTNNFGLGGRFGYRIQPRVNLEAELAYDYGLNTQQTYTNITNGNLTAIEKTSIGVTQGWIGPTFESATGRFRPFATLKGGFMDFRLSPSLVPYSSLTGIATGLHSSSMNAAIYPAAGAEASLGPVGLRLEAGDAIDFDKGAHNNLRITFGPILRF